jgi:hypothetical protein
MVRKKLDQFREEAGVEPYELEVDDGRIITVLPPTTDAMMTIGETPVFKQRELLQLLCGEAFDDVWKAIGEEQGNVAAAVVVDMAKHFKMGLNNIPGGFGALPS